MLDKKDAQWWVLEAEKHPDTAIDLIRMLADRLSFLDKQNEALRGEMIALKRKTRGESENANVEALQQRIRELEVALQQGHIARQLLVYAADRIEIKAPLDDAIKNDLGRQSPDNVSLLICDALARLLVITAESQAFNISLNDLPTPDNAPALLGNPNNIATILDQAVLETYHFMTVLTQNGYVYSLLMGAIPRIASKGDKLLRHIIPGDQVVAAVPSYNAELFAIARSGRWTRFPEKAIVATGSQVFDLAKGDTIASLVALNSETDLTFLTMEGKLFIRSSVDFKPRRSPGSAGVTLFKGHTILGATASKHFTILTAYGHLLNISQADLPFRARTETGLLLPGLTVGDSIVAFVGEQGR
ncbi:MAG: hypothetical protein ABI947_17345 [Chloroflexota bacterium]